MRWIDNISERSWEKFERISFRIAMIATVVLLTIAYIVTRGI